MIQATHLPEPDLEFGAGRHIDVRFGIANYGPFDRDRSATGGIIRLGIVGTAETLDGVLRWLERCGAGVAAKESRRVNLFPAFPGFGKDSPFGCEIVCESRCQRTIPNAAFVRLSGAADHNSLVVDAVGLFLAELDYLATETNAQVLVCAPPQILLDLVDEAVRPLAASDAPEGREDPEFRTGQLVFHHLLKARAMAFRRPVQMVRPTTYGGAAGKKKRSPLAPIPKASNQDEATRAWNLHAALYYKAGGAPWRLVREPSALTTCYVGLSFYRTLDESTVMTSLAQVFNERGDGLIVRGGMAQLSKEDRSPHLSEADARTIMADALKKYRAEHKTAPARVVMHKSSYYLPDEIAGFRSAIEAERIELADFVSIRPSGIRLFRNGAYPPLRGTLLSLQPGTQVLYAKGSVPFFEAYPGLYVPHPLEIRFEDVEQPELDLAREILALTKMNWNNTQFDGGEPITLRAARQVGAILKYINSDEDLSSRYSYYM